MTDRIIKALGAIDEHDALRQVSEANEFMAAVRAATGRETYAAAIEVINNGVSLAREIGVITEKTISGEQLGTVLAWKSSHEQLPALNAKFTELEESGRKRDVAALIKAGLSTAAPSAENPYAGKLTPALAKLCEGWDSVKLEEFLKVAGRQIPSEAKPAASNLSNAASTTPSGRAANEQGKTYEQIAPAELVKLKKSDKDLYNALREDWIAAGKPANESTLSN